MYGRSLKKYIVTNCVYEAIKGVQMSIVFYSIRIDDRIMSPIERESFGDK